MVRLRVLQAQVEIVDGNIDRANALLAAALQLRDKLVPNEAAISQLMECGLTNAEAKEALIATVLVFCWLMLRLNSQQLIARVAR